MGSFVGHVVPGTFFALFGVWFTYRVFLRYFMCQRAASALGDKCRTRYRNTSSFRCVSCCPRVPLEGILKIVASVVGMTGEFVTGFVDGKFSHLGNAQHMTMFFFFGLNGAVDMITHYRVPLPPDMDFVSSILALGMEALIFFYHLHGRNPMDIQVHMLLVYVVVASAVSVTMEMCYKTNVLPALCRCYFTLLQGTWFYQIGFILYPPWGEKWAEHDHGQMMIVTLLFTWHNATIFVIMVLAGFLIYLRVKALPPSALYHSLHHHLPQVPSLKNYEPDHTKNILQDSDEEEV